MVEVMGGGAGLGEVVAGVAAAAVMVASSEVGVVLEEAARGEGSHRLRSDPQDACT